MSAISTTFAWVRNPTAINGLATTYVSKRGSDTIGDGTAQNPYASIAKATSVATTNTNIMLDDGEWNEARTANNRAFNWWGMGKTKLFTSNVYNEKFYHLIIDDSNSSHSYETSSFFNCIVLYFRGIFLYLSNSISLYDTNVQLNGDHSIIIKTGASQCFNLSNCILDRNITPNGDYIKYTNNNFTTATINSKSLNSINDATTGQTFSDYFNYVHPNVLANPSTATIDDWLKCDFTAKAGSANIGAGEKGTTIGLNQGYTMYADNSSNDVFKTSNGAVLKNIEWNSTLNGYTIVQKEKLCQGATSNTITLDSSASSVDDYYNNLLIGIVGGDGFGELFKITDYNGATKTATIDGTWTTTPTTSSVYTISGSIVSAVKDFGKVIKIKRNFSFFDNISALSNGEWSQFLTHTTTDDKQFPISSFSYEYSIDGTFWYRGTTADDLVSATNGENKVCEGVYGDCSNSYDEETAMNTTLRYVKILIHIGFNIGF